MIDVLAELPLACHPGASWEYSVATDVLARLVEVTSGQRFDAFIQSRILGPLGMVDTGFVVSDRNRLVAYYASADLVDPMKPGLIRIDDAPYPGAYLRPFPRQNGGAGLVSTLPDMVALVRSLLPGDQTLLKPDTIQLMMTNQLPEGVWIRFPAFGELQGRGTGSRER
jgi:CubicO group peptidase (beta-lactamase class C family)